MTITPGAHIQLEDITHSYRGGSAPVLTDITLEIQPAEAIAIVGRSGCGKSTLLHIISGLMKAAKGKVWIDGRVINDPSPKWNMMFQQPSLYPWMTVADNAALGLRFTGQKPGSREKVAKLLEMVDLGGYLDTNVQALSGGQQQRVALARSLATEPEALLLDEPFSALDTFTRAALQKDVRTIAKKLGITLILVTHDIDEAVLMADRIIVMSANPGQVEADIPVTLPEDRDRKSQAFQTIRHTLMGHFTEAASAAEEIEDGTNDGPDAPSAYVGSSAA